MTARPSQKPILVLFGNDQFVKQVGPKLSETVPSVFARIVCGSKPADIECERYSTEPVVMALAGQSPVEVLELLNAYNNDPKQQQQRVLWMHSLFTGVDAYQLPLVRDKLQGIPFSNARGVFSPQLAEHVIFACMYFNRQLMRLVRNKEKKLFDAFTIADLRGQSIGIVGYGDIGKEVARYASKMGMKVTGVRSSSRIATTTTSKEEEEEQTDDIGTTVVSVNSLDNVLATSDVVVAVLPSTSSTKHLFDASKFAKMKKSGLFVNIGRGSTVVEDDLVDALESDVIRGAALDVFEVEPLPAASRLWDVDAAKLLLTPHNADHVEGARYAAALQFVELGSEFVKSGKLPPYLVDLGKGY